MSSKLDIRECGALHPDGFPCMLPVYYEGGCCFDKVYPHEEPHEAIDGSGNVIKRWEEVTKIVDLPFDAYSPRDSDKAKEEAKRVREEMGAE